MTNKTLLKIPMANLEELNALWNADPAKRLPTLLSRRRWAEARNLDVNKVHRWWRDQRSKAKRNHIWVSETESYDIPVGTPPILGPEDQLSVEAMDEDKPISVSVKKEPYTYSKSLFRPATAPVRLTRARARAARETASTSTHVDQSRSSPEPESSLPSSSPPSLFDQYSSFCTPPTSPSASETPRTPSKRAYSRSSDKIFELSLSTPENFHYIETDVKLEDEPEHNCTFGLEGVDGFVCQLCSTYLDSPEYILDDDALAALKDLPQIDFLSTSQLTGDLFSSEALTKTSQLPDDPFSSDNSSISWHLSAIPFDSRSPDLMLTSDSYLQDCSPLAHPHHHLQSMTSLPSTFILDGYEFTCNGYMLRKCPTDSPDKEEDLGVLMFDDSMSDISDISSDAYVFQYPGLSGSGGQLYDDVPSNSTDCLPIILFTSRDESESCITTSPTISTCTTPTNASICTTPITSPCTTPPLSACPSPVVSASSFSSPAVSTCTTPAVSTPEPDLGLVVVKSEQIDD